jgi:hypothetical protein
MLLKPGTRLRSTVSETQVIVVKAPGGEVDLTCGGAPMVALEAGASDAGPSDAGPSDAGASDAGATLLGKRYADEETGIELLCTKAGAGALAVDGAPLGLKEAKPLPSSD